MDNDERAMTIDNGEDQGLVLPQRLDAVGVWDGNQATVFQHRGPVFHKLATAKRKGVLMLTTEETVYALLRTKFALLHEDTLERATAEELLCGIVAAREFERLLRVHVYLAVIAQGKVIERIPRNADPVKLNCPLECADGDEQRQDQAAAHASYRTSDPSLHGGTPPDLDEAIIGTLANNPQHTDKDYEHTGSGYRTSAAESTAPQTQPLSASPPCSQNLTEGKPWPATGKLNDVLQRIELDGAKCMPHELLQKFREICGTIYPVEPVTIYTPIFAIEGTPVYAVTADATCSNLLGSSATASAFNVRCPDDGLCLDASSNDVIKDHCETEAVDKDLGQISQCEEQQPGVENSHNGCITDDAGSEGANGRCIVAVSNFDTVYFLDLKNNITY
ncbi:phenylalanyl-tRNA synthetase subunit beta, putative [Babesia ovata]|uniref:Phenylalanyl-tRNA synthetase subunit beta, putative n=1 Tax=Babesia ovata TaxID=189622 RepID=A0A2H6K863_9APIC|nr:phenylalanyl-tRNA synthetase subunit beta, putative [Babesia ovata]GBE59185.1 phenylalanyl-tRNA synthetase subunit beta, putative [Babesia ovata]